MLSKPTLLILALFLSLTAASQEKIEQERRVKAEEVPAAALAWLNNAMQQYTKVKWYAEVSEKGLSYEAKFRWKKARTSVEFNTSGRIEDIEVEIEKSSLTQEVQKNIREELQAAFQKFHIRKTQRQYTGSPDALTTFFEDKRSSDLSIHYEIEYYGKRDMVKSLWEGLFDDDGHIVQQRKVIVNPSLNLEF